MSSPNPGVDRCCPVCFEEIDYFSYGICNHSTCVKCILKLLKFGGGSESEFSKCPTCRQAIDRIVIVKSFVPFDELDVSSLRHDPQLDFLYSDPEIHDYCSSMLKSVCPICGQEMKSLSALNRHTTFEHHLSYCDLCIRYARLLPCEFSLMKTEDLVKHRKWDKVKSRGHPLCDFCDERFYEMEDLVRHIRNQHFLCDLCSTSGKLVVYREQWELLDHYGESHHLCTECRAQQRISCFASADRLGLHRFQEHPREVANDPNPWLPITISHAPNRSWNAHCPDIRTVGGILDESDGAIQEGLCPRPNPREWTGDDFPTLATPSPQNVAAAATRTPKDTVTNPTESQTPTVASLAGRVSQKTKGGKNWVSTASHVGMTNPRRLTNDDFPSLPRSSTTPTNTGASQNCGRSSNQFIWNGARQLTSQATANMTASKVKNDTSTNNCDASDMWSNTDYDLRAQPTNTIPYQVKQQPPSLDADFPDLPTKSTGPNQSTGVVPPSSSSFAQKCRHSRTKMNSKPAISSSRLIQQNKPNCKNLSKNQKHTAGDRSSTNSDFIGPDPRADVDDISTYHTYNRIQLADALLNTDPIVQSTSKPSISEQNDFPGLKRDRKQINNKVPKKQVNGPGKSDSLSSSLTPSVAHLLQLMKALKLSESMDIECLLYAEAIYTPLPDMEARNVQLIRSVDSDLSNYGSSNNKGAKNAFDHFADLSRRYRYRQINAHSYFEGLLGLLYIGRVKLEPANADCNNAYDIIDKDIPYWLAPMISLLPDIGLQRALLRVLQGQGLPRIPADVQTALTRYFGHPFRRPKESFTQSGMWLKKVTKLLQVCQSCGQVCLKTDIRTHCELAHPVK